MSKVRASALVSRSTRARAAGAGIPIALAFALAVALVASPALAKPDPSPRSREPQGSKRPVGGSISAHVPRQLIVGFEPSFAEGVRAGALRRTGARLIDRLPVGAALVQLPASMGIRQAMRIYERDPSVAWVVPNMLMHRDEVVPADPLFAEQWALRNVGQPHQIAHPPPATVQGLSDADVDASDAWSTTTGSAAAVIAILDSGVDVAHPDLQGSLWSNVDEIAGNGLDDDGNGYVDDTYGWDFIENDGVPQDAEGHGTLVAGVIAAGMNNGVAGSGVCPGCRLMVLRLESLAQELDAIAYAIDNGADIINASYGWDAFLAPERHAFQAAYGAGVLSVVSAGNEAADNDMLLGDLNEDGVRDAPLFPASFDIPGIVSVAASNDLDRYGYQTDCAIHLRETEPCLFTSLGHDSVDLAAPGVDVLTTSPGGGYDVVDGTSFAAPLVSGVAGLVESAHPEYGPLQLRDAILNAVDHPADLQGGWTATGGRLNAAGALFADPTTTVPLSSGNIAGAARISGTARGRVSYPSNVNDVFKVRLRAGSDYGVRLDVPAGRDYDLYVWKPGTVQIWQIEPGCDGTEPCRWLRAWSIRGRGKPDELTFRAGRSGMYYIQVSSWFSTGGYRLEVVRL